MTRLHGSTKEAGSSPRDPEPGQALHLRHGGGAPGHRPGREAGEGEHVGMGAGHGARGTHHRPHREDDMNTNGNGKRPRGTGRLFQRGGVWWIAYYHRGQEIRESAKTASEQKAGRLLRERLRTAGRPEFIGPAAERLTFDDLS